VQHSERIEGDELLAVDEVCARLAVRRPSIYALIQRGELPAVRVGRLWRIPSVAVEHFVARGGSAWK
jgi:excisionase family DNA binding protein